MFEILPDFFLHPLVIVNGQNPKNFVPVQDIQMIEMIVLADINSVQKCTLLAGDGIPLGMFNAGCIA